MKRRTTKGQGFSLYDLSDSIAQAVEILNDALEGQGVTVQKDNLFLQLQAVVKSVGDSSAYGNSAYPMMASDERAPYSVAGDFLAIAHQEFEAGNKKEAVTAFLEAAASEDFSEIANGLLEMNKRSEIQRSLTASENSDDDEDEDEDGTTENENDDSETDEDDDLSEEEIDELIENSENTNNKDSTVEAEDSNPNPPAKPKPTETKTVETGTEGGETDEDKDDNEEENKTKAPMGGTSSEVTASLNTKILANKLSLDGSSQGRKAALDFMRKHPRVGS